jgi:hypothetical protein
LIHFDDDEPSLASERAEFDYQRALDSGIVRVLLEKDFACIERQAGAEADDAFPFPSL